MSNTGIMGVSKRGRKYIATYCQKHLGTFDTIEEAQTVYEIEKEKDKIELQIFERMRQRCIKEAQDFPFVQREGESDAQFILRKRKTQEAQEREKIAQQQREEFIDAQLAREEEERLAARKRAIAKTCAQYSVANAPENGADS